MFTDLFENSKEKKKLLIPEWNSGRSPSVPKNFKEGAYSNSPETELENRVWRFIWSLKPDVINKPKFEFDFSEDETLTRDGRRPDAFAILRKKFVFINESKFTAGSRRTKTGLEDDPHFSDKLRNSIQNRCKKLFDLENPMFVYLMTTDGWDWNEDEKSTFRKTHKTIVLTIKELEYFENCLMLSDSPEFTLNQFCGFYLNNTKGLTNDLNVNAFKIPQGVGKYSYTFSATPREMMKMSMISHRQAKNLDLPVYEEIDDEEINKEIQKNDMESEDLVNDLQEEESNLNDENSEAGFHQRILTKGRLKSLKTFIEDNDRAFYNNILVSWRGKDHRFIEEKVAKTERGVKLNIKGYPGSFHVIDGQHRLFGYSEITDDSILDGHHLIITCFKGSRFNVKDQAKIFKEVNSQQKKVDKGLLYEIDAILGTESTGKEQKDILAKVIIGRLRDDPNSPFAKPKAIKEPELPRQKAPLTPVGLVDYGLIQTDLIGKTDDIKTGTAYLKDFDTTIHNITLLLAKFFEKIKKSNEAKWNKDFFLKNYFINGLIRILDRIVNHVGYTHRAAGKTLAPDKLFDSCSKPIDFFCEKLTEMNPDDEFEFFDASQLKKFRGSTGPKLALEMMLYKFFKDEKDFNGIITPEEIKSVENMDMPEESQEVINLKNRIAELEKSGNPDPKKQQELLKDIQEQTKTEQEQAVLYELMLYQKIDPIMSIVFGEDYYKNLIQRHIKEVHKRVNAKIEQRESSPLVAGMTDENEAFYTKEIYWTEPSDLIKMFTIFTSSKKDQSEQEKKKFDSCQNQSQENDIKEVFKKLFFIAPKNLKGKKSPELNSKDGLEWLRLMNTLRRPVAHPRPENLTIASEILEFRYYEHHIKLMFARMDRFIKDHTE